MVDMNTTNKSFLDMHEYLKKKGIKNNAFMLELKNPDLAGVDPHSTRLSLAQKAAILKEVRENYWYFLREVVRIPMVGGYSPKEFKLTPLTLAAEFLMTKNKDIYIESPIQSSKNVAVLVRLLFIYNFFDLDSTIIFAENYSEQLLWDVVEYRNALPSYLITKSPTKYYNKDKETKKVLRDDRIVTISSMNKSERKLLSDLAGISAPNIFMDNFAFMEHNKIFYANQMPSYADEAKFADINNKPHGIIMTSIPGRLDTNEGEFAKYIRDRATPFDISMYDMSDEELNAKLRENIESRFICISMKYKEIGLSDEWYENMKKMLANQEDSIRRELDLEWF